MKGVWGIDPRIICDQLRADAAHVTKKGVRQANVWHRIPWFASSAFEAFISACCLTLTKISAYAFWNLIVGSYME